MRKILKIIVWLAVLLPLFCSAQFRGRYRRMPQGQICVEARQYRAAVVANGGNVSGNALKSIISPLIVDLKKNGVFSQCDRFYLLANESSIAALTSLVRPTSAIMTPVNSPTFSVWRGYTGDGATQYINSNYNPSVAGNTLSVNSACLGVWALGVGSITTMDAGLSYFAGTNRFYQIAVNWNATQFLCNVNDGAGSGVLVNDGGVKSGFFAVTRSNATHIQTFVNGVAGGLVADASIAVPVGSVYMLCRNGLGTPGFFSTRRQAVTVFGNGAINQTALYNVLLKYQAKIGF